MDDAQKPHTSTSGLAAFAYPDFRRFELARVLFVMSWQMQGTAVAWQVYGLTQRSPLALGTVGLVQFFPAVLFILATGHVADRYDRKVVVATCMALLGGLSLLMAALTLGHQINYPLLLVLIFLIGSAHAFAGPASQALLPQLVPAAVFRNAVAWNSSIWQMASIVGPAAGGLLLGVTDKPEVVYVVDGSLALIAAGIMASIRTRTPRLARGSTSIDTLVAGFRYVWQNKIILGAITLDLFAVLLGGAVALLPIYAEQILHVGAFGYGLLRAAPSLGAGIMAIVVAHLPPFRQAGRAIFAAVAVFGIMTVTFGLSRSFPLSLVALIALGAADMISVVIRHTVVQLVTPPEMRGRVSAVNLIFIGASNQLGEFESGLTAHWFGTVPAVVLGGLGTLIVAALCWHIFPDLRNFGPLDELGSQTAANRKTLAAEPRPASAPQAPPS